VAVEDVAEGEEDAVGGLVELDPLDELVVVRVGGIVVVLVDDGEDRILIVFAQVGDVAP
jgi:hypothetical protein